jgi:DNA-binding Lrp family transcriptional regulator
MNIQSEKLQLIEWLVQLQDMTVIERIKKLRDQSIVKKYEAGLKPMSSEELERRADASNKAIEEGRVSDIESIVDEDWDS